MKEVLTIVIFVNVLVWSAYFIINILIIVFVGAVMYDFVLILTYGRCYSGHSQRLT